MNSEMGRGRRYALAALTVVILMVMGGLVGNRVMPAVDGRIGDWWLGRRVESAADIYRNVFTHAMNFCAQRAMFSYDDPSGARVEACAHELAGRFLLAQHPEAKRIERERQEGQARDERAGRRS